VVNVALLVKDTTPGSQERSSAFISTLHQRCRLCCRMCCDCCVVVLQVCCNCCRMCCNGCRRNQGGVYHGPASASAFHPWVKYYSTYLTYFRPRPLRYVRTCTPIVTNSTLVSISWASHLSPPSSLPSLSPPLSPPLSSVPLAPSPPLAPPGRR